MTFQRRMTRTFGAIGSLAAAFVLGAAPATAAPGGLLATVTLPGNGFSVSGSTIPGGPSGVVYIAPRSGGTTDTWDIYDPPAGSGAAALLATKTFVDAGDNPVAVSCGTWDPTRNRLWVANTGNPGPVYSVDLGDLTASGDAVATFEFDSNVGGLSLCDGIAYDINDDTLWISPDVNLSVFHYGTDGTLIGSISPENAAGVADGSVSGVTVGSDDTLYIGRNGFSEIRRVNKADGSFVSTFATAAGRDEDLSCDPVTYAPLEAIISKDAYGGFYEAFEVEEGTCPLPPIGAMMDIKFLSNPNGFNCRKNGVLPVTVFGMDNLDVTQINFDTVMMDTESGSGSPISAVNASFEDRGDPETDKGADQGAIVDDVEQDYLNPDGLLDYEVKFDAREVADLIDCGSLSKKDASETLVVYGELNDGTPWATLPIGDVGIDQLYIQNN